jgi:hypothetical protein
MIIHAYDYSRSFLYDSLIIIFIYLFIRKKNGKWQSHHLIRNGPRNIMSNSVKYGENAVCFHGAITERLF